MSRSLLYLNLTFKNACIQLENEEFGNTKVFAKVYFLNVHTPSQLIDHLITQHPVNFQLLKQNCYPFVRTKSITWNSFFLACSLVTCQMAMQQVSSSFSVLAHTERINLTDMSSNTAAFACRKIIYQRREDYLPRENLTIFPQMILD